MQREELHGLDITEVFRDENVPFGNRETGATMAVVSSCCEMLG